MGFPPPLVPHINCEPRRPLPTERWDWVVCRNALWVNRLWSAIYPCHAWGPTAVSPVLFLPAGRKDLTPRIGPRDGDPYGVSRTLVPRRGPSRHPLSNVLKIHAQSVVNFGELSAPLISGARRPAPRPPSGDGTCRPESPTLGLCLRPSLFATHYHLDFLNFARSLLRGAVCSPSLKVGDLRPPTPVHLTGTSSDERNR
jgi:hypothetical protein